MCLASGSARAALRAAFFSFFSPFYSGELTDPEDPRCTGEGVPGSGEPGVPSAGGPCAAGGWGTSGVL